MKRVVNGIHWSNQRHWWIEDACRVDRGRGCVTVLHHLLFPRDELADQWGDVENRYVFGKLRFGWKPQGIAAAPDRLIHIRLYHPDWRKLDPKVWAEHAARLLSNWQFEDRRANLWDDPLVAVSPANEQDIEGWIAASALQYEDIGRWNLAFWDALDKAVPGRRALSCWSALAGGHDAFPENPDSEYAVPAIRDAIQRCDLGAVHLYGHMEWGAKGDATLPGGADAYWHMLRAWRPKGFRESLPGARPGRPPDRGGFCAQFPGKPFIVSEAGTFAHFDQARTEQTVAAMRGLLQRAQSDGHCLGVTWFIWSTDAAHPTNNIGANPALRAALVEMPPFETTGIVPIARVGGVPVTPVPAPAPPPAPTPTVVEPRIQVVKGDGWLSIVRRCGQTGNTANVATLKAANPGVTKLTAGTWLRSPWHRVAPL